jgi:g-D-glutamyl-meso-diaminopimelate peptidase
VVDCEDSVTLREKSSSNSEQIGTLLYGDRVKVLGYQSQRFARIQRLSDGLVGYAIAGYLKLEDYSAFGLDIIKPNAIYSYDQLQADIAALEAAYPSKFTTASIGQSVEGREIPVLVIGDAAADKQVLIQGSIHAREHMTALLCMALTEGLLARGGEAGVCFHIIPMANPDGVTIQQSPDVPVIVQPVYTNDGVTGLSAETGPVYLSQWQANANGVDLNRNFDALWENIDTTPQASFMNYRGAAPESEPETKALVAYTDQYPFVATLSYHATGSAIYWEFGDEAATNAASKTLAEAISAVSAYELKEDAGNSFGGYKDWAVLKRQIPSVTVEIGTRTAPLLEPEFSNVFFRNQDVLAAVAEWARNR